MKHLAIVLALALLLSLPTFAGELTIKEAEEFFAQPQQLYEPPDEEFNKSMEQSVKEDPSLAEMLTPTKGYYYPAVNIYKIWGKLG